MTRAGCRWQVLLAACLGLAAVTGCAAGTSTLAPAGGAPPTMEPSSAPASPASSAPPGVDVAAFDALAAREASA
jgi:hypothetical protein